MLVYFFSSLQFLLYCVIVFFGLLGFHLYYLMPCFLSYVMVCCSFLVFFMYYVAFLCIDVFCVEFAFSLSAFNSCATESIL